jgi:hypothetical protein
MVMRVEEEALDIRDIRNHPAEAIDTLRHLLASGAHVAADPKRPNFYELAHGPEVFYIYVTPGTGQILLLATWSNELGLGPGGRVA